MRAALEERLRDHKCLGLGELGLDEGNAAEESVFRRQLNLAGRVLPVDKRIGIHTPRCNKAAVTRRTLALLEDYPRLHSSIPVDHVTPEILPEVVAVGYQAAMTLQEGKCSFWELLELLEVNPALTDSLSITRDAARQLS